MKIAAVYIRVSTEDQAELSPDSQLEKITEYASKNGYIIPDGNVFVDEGISGRSAKKRPQFNAMISLAKDPSHPVDTVLLWKFSRFARNQEESIVYKAMLKKSGVDVVSVSEPIIDGPFGSLIERIIEWMDEYYSIRLSGEVKRSMTLNAQRGVRQTAPPFGYRLNTEKDGPFMIPDEVEADIVREVFSSFVAGVPVVQMVRDLNARGIRTHRGGAIENRTITYWLFNPVYIGKNRWTPSRRIYRDFEDADTMVVDGNHEPLVTQECFDAAQIRLQRNRMLFSPKSRPPSELRDWISGVVRCAACGSTLIFQAPRYFVCNGHLHARCEHRQSITVDNLHEAVLGKLHADLDSAAPIRNLVVDRSGKSADELRRIRQQLDALDRKLLRVRESYAAGIDSLEEYKAFRDEIAAQRAELEQQAVTLEGELTAANSSKMLRDRISATLTLLEDPGATKEQKNVAIRDIVERCTWDRDAALLSITYRLLV